MGAAATISLPRTSSPAWPRSGRRAWGAFEFPIRGSVFFATGKNALDAAGQKAVADAAAAWKTAGGKGNLTLSGFADQKGNVAANMELAKKRAFAVRDALKRAGVAEGSIQLKKPETAVGGDGSESRRVDILSGA